MNEFSAVTDGIRGFGAAAGATATQVRGAAVGAAAAGPSLLAPAFGLIGGDFVAAFAATQGGHVRALGELAGVLESMSGAASATADAYDAADQGVAAALGATGAGLEA